MARPPDEWGSLPRRAWRAARAGGLAESDVQGILSGHVQSGTFVGIPLAAASSSAYGQDLAPPVGATWDRDAAQRYNLVRVYDGTIVHSAVGLEVRADVVARARPRSLSERGEAERDQRPAVSSARQPLEEPREVQQLP